MESDNTALFKCTEFEVKNLIDIGVIVNSMSKNIISTNKGYYIIATESELEKSPNQDGSLN